MEGKSLCGSQIPLKKCEGSDWVKNRLRAFQTEGSHLGHLGRLFFSLCPIHHSFPQKARTAWHSPIIVGSEPRIVNIKSCHSLMFLRGIGATGNGEPPAVKIGYCPSRLAVW